MGKATEAVEAMQTDGEPLPVVELRQLDATVAPELWQQLASAATAAGCTVERGPCGDANGWTRFDTKPSASATM